MDIHKIFYQGELITYYVKYSSKLRKISITVDQDLKIIVKTNPYININVIENFLLSNYLKIQKIIQRKQSSLNFNLSENIISIFGKIYQIKIFYLNHYENTREKFKINNNEIYLYLKNLENKEKIIRRLLKKEAKNYLIERTFFLAKQLNLVVKKVDIKWLTATWGICHKRTSSISFSAKLIIFDKYIIDYVIVHELVHLVEANHSDRFWNLVKKIMPDYKERKKLLKEF